MMATLKRTLCAALALSSSTALATPFPLEVRAADASSCPGYKASNVKTSSSGLTADLTLAGKACNVYGNDIKDLTLTVEYQTDSRLHVKIQDAANQVYQVPEKAFERPTPARADSSKSDLKFKYKKNPFSFSVVRRKTGEVLFDTSAANIVFEDMYIRMRTHLPEQPSLYGLGEHTDPFKLNSTNYTRTIWNRDAYTVPAGTNLYGDHPVYFDHRETGTHGVFLLNSNGMDIKIDNSNGQYLEYNAVGGIFDLYFVSGPSPVQVSQQYSEIVGKAAMMPYWGFGFHQCRYGMQDVYEVAEVVANYTAAGIPLETMWTDIDYMYLRQTFSLDPVRFPIKLMRELVDTLHKRDQHYIVMVDPAVAYQNYPALNDGVKADVFMKHANGSIYNGVVWPGETVFPDWFSPNAQSYWTGQFADFFNKDTGVDIDALWIDMNEASNFCDYPCTDPAAEAKKMGDPPHPPAVRLGSPRPIAGFPADFQPQCKSQVTFNVNANTFFGENIVILGSAITLGANDPSNAAPLSANNYPIWSATIDLPPNTKVSYQYARAEPDGSYVYEKTNRTLTTGGCGSHNQTTNDKITTSSPPTSKMMAKRDTINARGSAVEVRAAAGDQKGVPGRDLLNPKYTINNAAGVLSDKTIDVSLMHANGVYDYDMHNLYGAMMSEASRQAMLARRPTVRPLVITRSTFAGSGKQVGHWLGDNAADWTHYLISIAGMLEFNSLFQVPMVGSDVCGFAGTTNDLLCARWATLGAFSPFYRNHGELGVPPHEFYRYPLVASAAKNAIAIRYKLLDYFYTAFHQQTVSGTPSVQPMFFVYPNDKNTNSLQYQYFWGPGLMVAPVTVENSTSTSIYLPKDLFYDYYTHKPVQGTGSMVTLNNIAYDSIPLYYKGGSILAQRMNSANTTAELRKQDFELIIAPDANGKASGDLYLDEGNNIDQPKTSNIHFEYKNGKFAMTGTFGYDSGVAINQITVLGRQSLALAAAQTSSSHKIPLSGPVSMNV